MKLSVCISVHNTGKYIGRCLESLLQQQMEGMEVILVNNGSTDDSETIMRTFMRNHPEMKLSLYVQEDRGLAQGRQTGVDHAHGDYIAFLDADDYVLPGAYKKLYNKAIADNLDIVEMQTMRGDEVLSTGFSETMKCIDMFKAYCRCGGDTIHTMLWMRIYRRSLFLKPVFPQFYTNNEDYFAFPCLMFAGRSIGFVNEPLHVYSVDNNDSVMNRLEHDPAYAERFYDSRVITLKAFEHVWNYLEPAVREKMIDDLQLLKRIIVIGFLFRSYPGKKYESKMQDIVKNMNFSSEKEIIQFLREEALSSRMLDKMIRLFGVKKAYYLTMLKNKLRT